MLYRKNMKLYTREFFVGLFLLTFISLSLVSARAQGKSSNGINIPVIYYKLSNGLKVVLSQDKTAPTVVTSIHFNVGSRFEPRNRTGFSHLFEHVLGFEATDNMTAETKAKLVDSIGGTQNGGSRFDYINFYEVVPSHKLETMLWYQADRLRNVRITDETLKRQRGVVINEIKVNVLNAPYGALWLDILQVAYAKWENAHNSYGDLKDLEAATVEDATKFFNSYFAPNNAVFVVVGDFEIARTRQMIEKYFASIPSKTIAPKPDVTEPRQTTEKRASRKDLQAKRPAITLAYHMPDRNTPEYYAMGLLDQILIQGEDSLLYRELAKNKGYTGGIEGGINPRPGNMFNYNGPMLWIMNMIHDNNVKSDQILSSIDGVITKLQNKPIDPATLNRAKAKLLSGLYDYLTFAGGYGRADLLACFALFDDKPQKINQLEAEFEKVTPALIQKTARQYLRVGNRTILTTEPVTPTTQSTGTR